MKNNIQKYFVGSISHKQSDCLIDSEYVDKLTADMEMLVFNNNRGVAVINDHLKRPTYIEDCSAVLNIKSLSCILKPTLFDFVKEPSKFSISTVELHIRWPECEKIPPHQDNFYHQFLERPSFKCLIPLSECSEYSGFLHYFDVSHSFPILEHSASSVKGFSSYIDNGLPLDISTTAPNLKKMNVYFHSLNSIHFANTNSLDSPCFFLVARYDHIEANEDKTLREKYLNVRQKHLTLVKDNNDG